MRDSFKIGVFKENMNFFGENIEKKVKNKFFEADMSYDVICIDNVISISENTIDVLFVDIGRLMNVTNENIEKFFKNIKSYVVAIADGVEELLYAFKIKAYQALTKDLLEKQVDGLLDDLINEITRKNKIIIEDDFEQIIVDVSEIMYIEAIGDNSIVVTKDDSYYNKKPLKYWDKYFSQTQFYRCHKSYLVALDKILKIVDYNIYFKDSETEMLPVAVRRIRELKGIIEKK